MKEKTLKVAIVINVVPSYRRGFYKRILSDPEIDLTIYCQSRIKGFNLRLIHEEFGKNFIEVPFISTKRHACVWQMLPVRRLWRGHDVYFFYGNPRIVSTVVWATLFKVLGKKVVIWGQAHTAGAHPATEAIRLRWWRFFDNFLTYTDTEVQYLRCRGFDDSNILGMNNGLDQEEIEEEKSKWDPARLNLWQRSKDLQNKTIILSCARLVEKNCFHLMIEALPRLVETIPDLIWCVIGSGGEHNALKQIARKFDVEDRIIWVGELYSESELAPWFLSSALLVHPGAIGLTLNHAFGYGLPVITHDNPDFQMPEIAAFENGVNGYQFQQNNMSSLVDSIELLLTNQGKKTAMSAAALNTVRIKYNTDVMAHRFIQIAESAFKS